jgi:hypothetical protein
VFEQRFDQGRGNIGQPPGLGGELIGHVAHVIREIGYLRRHHENTRIFRYGHDLSSWRHLHLISVAGCGGEPAGSR